MKQLTTIINFVLDNTGSMQSIKESTISGFNEYVQSLQKKKGKFLFTLTKFNSYRIERPYVLTDIKQVKRLNSETYQPDGNTPLYDACVDTIEEVAKEVEGMESQPAVLVVIMTDGEENSSKRHTEQCLKDLIHKMQHKGNWTFIFLGANQDAWLKAQQLGISAANALKWEATDRGSRDMFRGLGVSTAFYAMSMESNSKKGMALNSSNFFDKPAGGDDKDVSQS